MNARSIVSKLVVVGLFAAASSIAGCAAAPGPESTGESSEALCKGVCAPAPPVVTPPTPTTPTFPLNSVSCDPGTTCSFSATGQYLEGSSGALPNCTQVYEFTEQTGATYDYDYFVAYCFDSSTVDSWVMANAKGSDAEGVYTTRALPTAGANDVYVRYINLPKSKCTKGGCPTAGADY